VAANNSVEIHEQLHVSAERRSLLGDKCVNSKSLIPWIQRSTSLARSRPSKIFRFRFPLKPDLGSPRANSFNRERRAEEKKRLNFTPAARFERNSPRGEIASARSSSARPETITRLREEERYDEILIPDDRDTDTGG